MNLLRGLMFAASAPEITTTWLEMCGVLKEAGIQSSSLSILSVSVCLTAQKLSNY